MNGASFTDFTLRAGTRATVRVPLVQGRNILERQMDSVRADGQMAMDQD